MNPNNKKYLGRRVIYENRAGVVVQILGEHREFSSTLYEVMGLGSETEVKKRP